MTDSAFLSRSLAGGSTVTVAGLHEALNQRLSDELDAFNAAATAGTPAAEEISVRVEADGELVAGVVGWAWGQAAGIAMTWVREDQRGTGVGAAAMGAFEAEVRRRGADHVFVTSFTFQAPGFYQRLGYSETSAGTGYLSKVTTTSTCANNCEGPHRAKTPSCHRRRMTVDAGHSPSLWVTDTQVQ